MSSLNFTSRWPSKRLGSIFVENKDKNTDLSNTFALQFSYGNIVAKPEWELSSSLEETYKGYTRVNSGDIVINGLNLNYDFVTQRVGLVRTSGIITSAYILLRKRINVSSGFYCYYFKAMDSQKIFNGMGTGIRLTLSYPLLKNLNVPVPPRAEQEQIVHFLDWKVSGINRLIENKRKKLNSLKELKKDIVDCTVKSGIRDDVPVRDSGVYWIGKIPSHWSVMRLKSQIKLSNEKTSDNNLPYIGMENIESWTGKYVKKNEVKPESTSNVYKTGNILFGKLRPYLAKVFITEDDGICSSEFLVFESFQLERKYLFYYLISSSFIDVVNSSTYGAKMPRANWDFIGNCPITIPPKEEQKEIVKYLDSVFIKIDSLIRNTEQIVERLRELKTRLISDVVTGQIDVRNIEIPEYEYVDEEPEGDSDNVNGDFDSEEISEEA